MVGEPAERRLGRPDAQGLDTLQEAADGVVEAGPVVPVPKMVPVRPAGVETCAPRVSRGQPTREEPAAEGRVGVERDAVAAEQREQGCLRVAADEVVLTLVYARLDQSFLLTDGYELFDEGGWKVGETDLYVFFYPTLLVFVC